MAQIIDIRPERHQLIFLDELPELNEESLLRIIKRNPMFPHYTYMNYPQTIINTNNYRHLFVIPTGSQRRNDGCSVKWLHPP